VTVHIFRQRQVDAGTVTAANSNMFYSVEQNRGMYLRG